MSAIILTGANGLLGHEVLKLYAEAGDDVYCLCRSRPEVEGANVHFIETDLSRALDTTRLPDSADAVVHLAQCEKFNDFPDSTGEVFAVNVAAPVTLLDWARNAGVSAFVHASSGGLYRGGDKPLRETDPTNLEGRLAFYLSTKLATENLAAAYSGQFSVAALRFFFIYGPRQRAQMLMPRLVGNVREGRPLMLQGDKGLCINPVHAIDAARAVLASVEKRTQGVVNIAGPETVSIRDIGQILGQHLGTSARFETQPDAKPTNLIADITRMQAELHDPTIRPVDGLREMCG